MYLFIASGLLIVCGIVDATIYNPRSQAFNQLMERRQRSIGFQYPHGYHYNPIEPSINDLDSLSEALDSRINMYKPIYQHFKISTHDVNSVPRTHSYQPKNSIYDSEYTTEQDIPNLFPENSYDYKYLGYPLNKYLTRPSTTESGIPINLVAIRKTSVFGYEFPTYKSPYSSDSVWNFGSKIPHNILDDSQSVETGIETLNAPSPIVRIVKLLPETLEQKPTTTTTKSPHDYLLGRPLNDNSYEVKDEPNHETTQKTPTESESNPITSEESQTMDQSNIQVLDENLIEDELNSITTENESNSITTEDESNSITTEDESNSITTEDESNSNTTEDESNSITTEENQTEDEESKSTTSQETTTAFKLNYSFDKHFYSNSDEDTYLKLKELLKDYEKLREQNKKSQFTNIKNVLTKSQSNLLSNEDANQQLQPQWASVADVYDEYD